MANRTYLYITESVEKREKIRGIGEYNYDFPLLFKVLCSVLPVAEKSSICVLEEKSAIIADMYEGIEKTEKFLLKMKETKIAYSGGKVLVSDEAYSRIIAFLSKDRFFSEGYRYFLLEAFELYEMSAESHEEFESLTFKDIEKINEINKDVENFIETGIISDKLQQEIGSYDKFQYELNCFAEYLYYDFSKEENEENEIYKQTFTPAEIPAVKKEKRLMDFDYKVIMFMICFLLIFPPVGIYFCYDGFAKKYDDRYTSGIILGLLGSGLTLFYIWKFVSFLSALF